MNVTLSGPNDPRMARLADAIRASLAAVEEFRDAMRQVNDPALHEAAAPMIEAAKGILAQHETRAELTIADDVANLRALFSHLPIPRADADFGPLPGIKALRSARGNLREDFNDILEVAHALGWHPSEPDLPDIGKAEISKQGVEGILQALVARMEAVERLLDQSVRPEGEPAPGRTTIQIALVQVFVKNMKMELALAKLEAQVKNIVDLAALGRSIENITELTADFVVTVCGLATKMTVALRAASEQLRPKVLKVARGFKAVVRKVASVFAHRKPDEDLSERPSDFDIGRVREMILAGVAPPVAWRPWIGKLTFTGKNLKDLAPLAGLTALQKLDLQDTPVSDLAPLAGLTALQELYLQDTSVSDLAPLAGLTALQRLYLQDTPVSDLAPLAGLTALQKLYLQDTPVSDLAPLAGLTALQELYLQGTPVSDLAALAGLTALQELYLQDTPVSDLAPFAGLTALQGLYLQGTLVSDLAPLAGLTALQKLYLQGTPVSDLAPLAGLSGLQGLNLQRTPVSDLASLAGLTALQELNLRDTPVSDLAALAGLSALRGLYLQRTPVSDLAPLTGLSALRRLNLRDAPVSDLAPLAGLSALQELSLQGTSVSDLAPLAGLSALRRLNLRDTPVSDLAPLAALKLEEVLVESKRRRAALANTLGARGDIVVFQKNS